MVSPGAWQGAMMASARGGDNVGCVAAMAMLLGGCGMKITIDIDYTPQETCAFLGQPDVAPMQEAMWGHLGGGGKSDEPSRWVGRYSGGAFGHIN